MNLYAFLAAHDIAFEEIEHPPVFTVAESRRLVPALPGAKVKNLFLYDGKGRAHFLVVVPDDKQVDLKALGPLLGFKRLSFCSPDRLMRCLAVAPGAVSLLAAFTDRAAQAVKVVLDQDLWQADAFQCHPLVNTKTMVIEKKGIERFLTATGHGVTVLPIPAKGK